jgi:hypothetical protein
VRSRCSTAARIPRSKPAISISTCRCCRPANFLGSCRTGPMSDMSSPREALRVAVAPLPPARAQGAGVLRCAAGIASPDRRDHGGMIARDRLARAAPWPLALVDWRPSHGR